MNIKTKAKENVKQIGRKMLKLGKEHGISFAIYAIIANAFDEIVIPAMFLYFGYPAISGLSLLADIDWITYPMYFMFVNIWQKLKIMTN